MKHYEERLEKDLAHIREKFAALARAVEKALGDGARALFTSDDELAYQVILGDAPINRASRQLDQICHGFIAVHLPSAGHLRFVSSVMRANLELERIGDYTVTICRESVQIGHPPQGLIAPQMEGLMDKARDILSQAVAAFNGSDADLARDGMAKANRVAPNFNTVFDNLVNEEGKLGVRELFYYLVIFRVLDRVVDQSKNICEETIFAVTGQTKPSKTYRVLFLDEDNSTLGPMAQAIARKNFPQSGEYDTAGRQGAHAINDHLGSFMEERGIELGDTSPKTLDPSAPELAAYHVIVSLQGPVKSYLTSIPFQTSALAWQIGESTADWHTAENSTQFETLYRTLALQVRDLMTTLHGEEAS